MRRACRRGDSWRGCELIELEGAERGSCSVVIWSGGGDNRVNSKVNSKSPECVEGGSNAGGFQRSAVVMVSARARAVVMVSTDVTVIARKLLVRGLLPCSRTKDGGKACSAGG